MLRGIVFGLSDEEALWGEGYYVDPTSFVAEAARRQSGTQGPAATDSRLSGEDASLDVETRVGLFNALNASQEGNPPLWEYVEAKDCCVGEKNIRNVNFTFITLHNVI